MAQADVRVDPARQQREIQNLEAALRSLQAQQHPVSIPAAINAPAAPAPAGVPAPAPPAPALRGASTDGEWPAEWLKHFSKAELEASAKEAEKWQLMARSLDSRL